MVNSTGHMTWMRLIDNGQQYRRHDMEEIYYNGLRRMRRAMEEIDSNGPQCRRRDMEIDYNGLQYRRRDMEEIDYNGPQCRRRDMEIDYNGLQYRRRDMDFQIGAGLYAVGRPIQKRNDEDGQIGTIQSLPLERGALFNRFFGEPAHGPPHVAGGASGPIGGCRDESRTDNPDLDLRHVFDRNNRKTDLI